MIAVEHAPYHSRHAQVKSCRCDQLCSILPHGYHNHHPGSWIAGYYSTSWACGWFVYKRYMQAGRGRNDAIIPERWQKQEQNEVNFFLVLWGMVHFFPQLLTISVSGFPLPMETPMRLFGGCEEFTLFALDFGSWCSDWSCVFEQIWTLCGRNWCLHPLNAEFET